MSCHLKGITPLETNGSRLEENHNASKEVQEREIYERYGKVEVSTGSGFPENEPISQVAALKALITCSPHLHHGPQQKEIAKQALRYGFAEINTRLGQAELLAFM